MDVDSDMAVSIDPGPCKRSHRAPLKGFWVDERQL